MSELERELILHERAEVRDDFLLKMQRKSEQRSSKPVRERLPSSRVISSSRKLAKTSKEDALNALVAKKRQRDEGLGLGLGLKNTNKLGGGKRKIEVSASDDEWAGESSSGHEDEEEEGNAEDEDDQLSKEETERSEADGGSDDEKGNDKELPDKKLIQDITLRRSKLSKWFMEPFFEDVIEGCLVKIGTGVNEWGKNEYKLYRVQNVDAKDPEKSYKFENKLTCKYLNCTYGDDSTAVSFQMIRASDQVPEDSEINAWLALVKECPSNGLTKAEAVKKKNELRSASTFVYSAATVKQMLQEKKQASARPSNIALEKDRVLKEVKLAESRGEVEEVRRLQEKLRHLEEYSHSLVMKNVKAERIAMMNRKNKMENFKNASEMKPISNAKAGEAGYDPFSRRWTRSQNYYKSDTPKQVKEEGEGAESDRDDSKGNARVAQEAYDGVSKVNNGSAPLEKVQSFYSLHNFELPISLESLEQFKGAVGAARAFMDRKRLLEARYDVHIHRSDELRHQSTLTVNDYKRRRGLL